MMKHHCPVFLTHSVDFLMLETQTAKESGAHRCSRLSCYWFSDQYATYAT